MRPTSRRPITLAITALAILLSAGAATGSGTGEFTLLGTHASGDVGGVESDTQSSCLRFRTGNETQFFAELEWRRTRSDLAVFASPLGPIPMRGRGPGAGPGRAGVAGQAIGSQSLQATQEAVENLPAAWNAGPGDVRLGISQRILGGGVKLFRVDAELGFKAPLADADEGLGTGKFDYRLGVSGSYRFWTLTAFGGIGWNRLGDPEWVDLADVVDAFVGLDSEPLHDSLVLSGWLEGNPEVVEGFGSRTALGFGIRSTGKLHWRVQVTRGLGGSAEDFSARAGLSFGVSPPKLGVDRIR